LNKKGGFTDIFLLMIIAFIVLLICGVFIYLGATVKAKLHETMDDMDLSINASQTIEDSMGKVTTAYDSLYWISVFLIFGMIISIFIGSYLVTTKPIFFVPYIFLLIIAIIVSVAISNAYEILIATPSLASTYAGFVGGNFFMLYLPVWVCIIGFLGGIIMFSRLGSEQEMTRFG